MKTRDMEVGVSVVGVVDEAEGARQWTMPTPAVHLCWGQMVWRAGVRRFEAVGTGVGGRVRLGMT